MDMPSFETMLSTVSFGNTTAPSTSSGPVAHASNSESASIDTISRIVQCDAGEITDLIDCQIAFAAKISAAASLKMMNGFPLIFQLAHPMITVFR